MYTRQYLAGDKTVRMFPNSRHQPNNHHSFTPGTKTLFLSKYFQNCLLAKTSQIAEKTVLAGTDNVMSYQVFSTEKRGGIGDKAEMI